MRRSSGSRRWARLGIACVGLIAAALLGVWLLLRGSLPLLDGALSGDALSAPVAIERDALGVPTIRAANRADLAYATGFVHAQDRFFQMDLARRLAAGELAELVGPAALQQDERARLFRFRAVARAALALGSPEELAVLAAYVRGVNAGLANLGSRPWEYWLLRAQPEPWRAEDSFLVAYAMWWQLQHNNLDRALIRNAIEMAITAAGSSAPRQALRFLYPRGTSWDAPNGEQPAAATDPLVPPPEVLDLRLHRAPVGVQLFSALPPAMAVPGDPAQSAERGAGSNNWALSGARTRSGAALVANDMHLGLGVPPTWYRAQLIVAGAAAGGGSLRLNGVTLPGMPVLVAGSNGSIAWGFSNSYGDWLDVTPMRCTSDGTLLRPDGQRERLTHVVETIRVKGAGAARLEFDSSPVGVRLPQADAPHAGADAPCDVVAWLATVPAATNLHLLKLERASSVDEAMALAPGLGMPHQNAVVGDAAGHIGWTTFGRIPRDEGVPAFLRNTGTLAWRDAASSPRIVDPASGAVWSANARAIEGDAEQALGGALADVGAGYDLGARARQIRDDLRQLTRPAGPSDMLAIQTDDRAVFLARWQSHLLALLDDKATRGKFERGEFRRLVAQWNGRASIDSVSYRLVRTFHAQLLERTWTLIMDELGVHEDVPPPQFEGALWQLVTRRPAHLLPVASESWRAFELEALDATLDELATSCRTLAGCTWGARRPVALRHPLSGALPGFLAALIDMPTLQLPGDHDMPRVQAGAFGASERFAVAPGHESEGYFELPGGQSGHPLSPFYRGGFDAWAGGTAQPFLPGPRAHKLVLQPAAAAPEASANP